MFPLPPAGLTFPAVLGIFLAEKMGASLSVICPLKLGKVMEMDERLCRLHDAKPQEIQDITSYKKLDKMA